MFNAMERMVDRINAEERIINNATRRIPWYRRLADLSLFAMAAWKRMAIGLGALLLLWLVILWAVRA